jgi:hypothetical protein
LNASQTVSGSESEVTRSIYADNQTTPIDDDPSVGLSFTDIIFTNLTGQLLVAMYLHPFKEGLQKYIF